LQEIRSRRRSRRILEGARLDGATGQPNQSVEELRRIGSEYLQKAEAAARRAIAADPSVAQAHGVMGLVAWARGKPLEAEPFLIKGVELSANDSEPLLAHAVRLQIAGRLKEQLELIQRAYALEPLSYQLSVNLTNGLWLNGKGDDAIAQAKLLRP